MFKRVVYIDMDGVIADFGQGMFDAGYNDPGEFKLVKGVYENLPAYGYAQELFDVVEGMGYEVQILTKIKRKNPFAATEKLLWMQKHFPKYLDKVTITHDKGAVGGFDDVLIDDRIYKANCENFKGILIEWKIGMVPNDIKGMM